MVLGLSIWDIIGFVDFIFLILFFYGDRNAVWAAFSAGIAIAAVTGIVVLIRDGSWPWEIFKRILVVVTFCGVIFEVASRIITILKKKRS